MFAIAFLIGLYANCLLLLGLANLYYTPVLIGFTVVFIFLSIIFWRLFDEKLNFFAVKNELTFHLKEHKVWVVLLFACFVLMLVGALVPETAFDSLWYHLTLPKIFLVEHGIKYIPGGLLYYSTMPKVGELLYIVGLVFGSTIIPKLLHFSFGLLTAVALYQLALKYLPRRFALLALVIFFTNIVVLWEGTTAYIDLVRTFFELMALWGLVEYLETKKRKWLIESALLLGLAVETKLVAIGTLLVMVVLLLKYLKRKQAIPFLEIGLYCLLTIVPSLGWLVFSFTQTGNPLYPLFSNYSIQLGKDFLAFPAVFIDPITIFMTSSDPVSPLYLLLLPLVFIFRKKLPTGFGPIIFYSIATVVIWTITPKTGGGRFLLPYLPALSLFVAGGLYAASQKTKLFAISLAAVFICMSVAISYRTIATVKYIPVLTGQESRSEFLTKNLNFSYGDYYDTDGQIEKIVKPSSKVLLYGFHNLYYMNVPFVDSSWIQKGETFDYIATQNVKLPARFRYWTPIYANTLTKVTLYTINQRWVY